MAVVAAYLYRDGVRVREVSIDEIGLLMGGVHGTAEETHIEPGAAHAVPA